MSIVALIPAYNPPFQLAEIVRRLAATDLEAVIVVNDGSSREKDPIFEESGRTEKVVVIKHVGNLGKGAALKTGLDYAYRTYKNLSGVVTVDADGQHLVEDVLQVARALKDNPRHLVLGVRILDKSGKKVPLRSRIGNSVARHLFRLMTGKQLNDTQTGLRGIPKDFVPDLLRMDSNGYEFELEMLLLCKYNKRSVIQREIRAVYFDGNRSSHFKPVIDSMKILFAFFRFT